MEEIYLRYFPLSSDPKEIITRKSRDAALNDLAKIIATWMFENGWFQTCLNCCDWNDKTEICMRFKQRPPAKVIVSGCEFHSDIPF